MKTRHSLPWIMICALALPRFMGGSGEGIVGGRHTSPSWRYTRPLERDYGAAASSGGERIQGMGSAHFSSSECHHTSKTGGQHDDTVVFNSANRPWLGLFFVVLVTRHRLFLQFHR